MSNVRLIDTPYSLAGRVPALKAAGVAGGIRYLSPNTASFPSKRLTLAEVGEAGRNGFWLGSVWEVMGDAAEMNSAVGKTHGGLATQVSLSVRQPAGSSIAFAVDYDAPVSDFDGIADYFLAVHQACREDGYLTTGYGSEKVENVIDAEQVTITSSAVFLSSLLVNYPPRDFQQVLLCNNGSNEIYVNFAVSAPSAGVGGTTNVSSSEYVYALDAGTMMPFWMGRGAFNQCCVVSPGGNSLAMVVVGA